MSARLTNSSSLCVPERAWKSNASNAGLWSRSESNSSSRTTDSKSASLRWESRTNDRSSYEVITDSVMSVLCYGKMFRWDVGWISGRIRDSGCAAKADNS